MALSYLNKKNWHPEKIQNIEAVWQAESAQAEAEKKQSERIKKLKEEKHIEDLKRLQVQQGIIPASHLERVQFMYDAGAGGRQQVEGDQEDGINFAEDYLLGKPINQIDRKETEDKQDIFKQNKDDPQQFVSFGANDENEAFKRMVEDPLVLMKSREI